MPRGGRNYFRFIAVVPFWKSVYHQYLIGHAKRLAGEGMYLDFFSLTEKPFDITPDTRFFYLSPQHEEAVVTLLYGVRERRGFMMLTGEVGTGKTTSIRALLNRIDSNTETALVINPLLSTVELLKSINKDFGCDSSQKDSIQEQIDSLNQFLLKSAEGGHNSVVIIDEAQNLSQEALEMVRLLSNLETETHKLLQIILVGQPELNEKLNQPNLRQLRQRIQVRYALHPLNPEETKRYILFRLNKATPKCCLVFQPSALKRIYEYSGGIPRLINNLCELTLMSAYTEETHIISRKTVDAAFAELKDKSWSRPLPLWRRIIGGRRVASP